MYRTSSLSDDYSDQLAANVNGAANYGSLFANLLGGATSGAAVALSVAGLQAAINRFAGPMGFAPIGTDGAVGSETQTALNAIIKGQSIVEYVWLGLTTSYSDIASNADILYDTVSKWADAGSFPHYSNGSVSSANKPPVSKAPLTKLPPSPFSALFNGTTMGLPTPLVLGGAGVLGYLIWKKHKKGKGKR